MHDMTNATRPDPDPLLVEIAEYVTNYAVQSSEAYDTARLCRRTRDIGKINREQNFSINARGQEDLPSRHAEHTRLEPNDHPARGPPGPRRDLPPAPRSVRV